ncbi:MAG: hypothetical protein U0235_07900 [Polyangiaceae bacterium]
MSFFARTFALTVAVSSLVPLAAGCSASPDEAAGSTEESTASEELSAAAKPLVGDYRQLHPRGTQIAELSLKKSGRFTMLRDGETLSGRFTAKKSAAGDVTLRLTPTGAVTEVFSADKNGIHLTLVDARGKTSALTTISANGSCTDGEMCRAGQHCQEAACLVACMPNDPHCCPSFCVDDPVPSKCGANTCGAGQYCCNESCGICAPMGAACIQMVCAPAPGTP